ncbi:MAG: proteasome accessory factor PafA2 [Acidobacteria bacterium]|nr:proteasome accessory factor PafA2 [Acidobacteriota bacterium]
MAIAKICGIETEYGIVWRGIEDPNPITASSVLINSYVTSLAERAGRPGSGLRFEWDFESEQPGTDARGFAPLGALPPEVESHLVNAVLTNGARYYVDHAHPEMSTPECTNARDVVVFDRAAELVLQRSMETAARVLPPGQEIVVYKNNSDGKGNSYGCHENYLVDRNLPFGEIVHGITPHFVTRQIFCGAGKVGSESHLHTARFQISQRADFFEEEVGLETTLKRPIINTRDEPHADPIKYRRLHVIIGDANMSEVATFLKVGTTALVLAMLEDGVLPRRFQIDTPVPALRQVSCDLSLTEPLRLRDGTTATALEIQWEFLRTAQQYASTHGLAVLGADTGERVLEEWESVLTGLEQDPSQVADRVDWVAKHRLVDGYRQRHDLDWGDPRLVALDLQYHDLRPDRSLARRVGLRTLCSESEILRATEKPPTDTRAYFRGTCLEKFGSEIIAANWDSMVFDIGEESLRRVPMMEPQRGTVDHVGPVIASCDTAAELLDRLASS